MSAKLKSKSKPINTTSDELIVKEISFEKYPMSLFDIGYSEAKKNNFKEFTVTKVSTCNSEEYNIIDGTSLGVKIHFDDLYGKRDEIFEYKRKNLNSDLLLEKTAPVSSKLKTQSKLDQRLNFFKLWLIGSSGGSIHNEDDLQKRYENMGSPTRGKIWLALQSADNKLFGSGKDDFLKAMANIISLKGGTGKHR
jgi:hypothetical protein